MIRSIFICKGRRQFNIKQHKKDMHSHHISTSSDILLLVVLNSVKEGRRRCWKQSCQKQYAGDSLFSNVPTSDVHPHTAVTGDKNTYQVLIYSPRLGLPSAYSPTSQPSSTLNSSTLHSRDGDETSHLNWDKLGFEMG